MSALVEGIAFGDAPPIEVVASQAALEEPRLVEFKGSFVKGVPKDGPIYYDLGNEKVDLGLVSTHPVLLPYLGDQVSLLMLALILKRPRIVNFLLEKFPQLSLSPLSAKGLVVGIWEQCLEMKESLDTLFECMRNPLWAQRKRDLCLPIATGAVQLLGSHDSVKFFYENTIVPFLAGSKEEQVFDELQGQEWGKYEGEIRASCDKLGIANAGSDEVDSEAEKPETPAQKKFRDELARYFEKAHGQGDPEHTALLMKPYYATTILEIVAESQSAPFFEAMKKAVGIDDQKQVKGNVKDDTLRIIEKIKDYSKGNTRYGYQYIKDAVRMAFRFPDPKELQKAFAKLLKNAKRNSAEILEVKCKLSTKLRNVTVVVGFTGDLS